MGTIHWGKKVLVATKQSSWYDHSFWDIPYSGEADLPKMVSAITKARTHQFLGNFGGQTHVGEVSLLPDNKLRVETMYSIGS